jgi:hypothetical protein
VCEGKDAWSILEPRARLRVVGVIQVLEFGIAGRKDALT